MFQYVTGLQTSHDSQSGLFYNSTLTSLISLLCVSSYYVLVEHSRVATRLIAKFILFYFFIGNFSKTPEGI